MCIRDSSDSLVFSFLITKDTFLVAKQPVPKLSTTIAAFRKSILKKDTENFKRYGRQLYKDLIKPLEGTITTPNVLIVPDGMLWNLNFDLLLTEDASSNNPKKLPFLIRKHAISYLNSSQLLETAKDTNANAQKCLAFSFSQTDTVAKNSPVKEGNTLSLEVLRSSNADLPGTKKEIKAISDILEGQYYFGTNANETNFKKEAPNYDILHLALHGELDPRNPEYSKLIFTKNTDSSDDGALYAHELFSMELPAKLAVLSACNTGSGKTTSGEGIMSLGTAFRHAGVESLVLTNWEISDRSTPTIMTQFYGNLQNGMTKSEALQKAKLSFLDDADPNYAHPMYWGGLYIVGNPNALHETNAFQYVLFIVLGIAILGIAILLTKTQLRHD